MGPIHLTRTTVAALAFAAAVCSTALAQTAPAAPPAGRGQAPAQPARPGLIIIVTTGQNAVNTLQPKAATSPVVEIRDRANAVVSGASITLTITTGQAATFEGGALTFTGTTNAAGRLTAPRIDPLASGRLQMTVRASYQGQAASATITQTIVATATASQTGRTAGGTTPAQAARPAAPARPNAAAAAPAPAPARLTIVVIEGEDAVNIIQQRTAVAPIVEVRDQNNQPVAGVLVTFSMSGGQNATFAGGLQSVTVTTNAAGRAAASPINPLTGGRFQIQVQANFQGQTASTTVTQTNFTNAAQAQAARGNQGSQGSQGSQAGAGGQAAAGAAAGAAGAAGGGGGGLSALAIGGIAAGAGGGALIAVKAAGGDDGGGGGGARSFSGPFSGPYSVTVTDTDAFGVFSCTATEQLSGTVTIELTSTGSTAAGTLTAVGTASNFVETCTFDGVTTPILLIPDTSGPVNFGGAITGSSSSLQFVQSSTDPSGFATNTISFTGSLQNDVITGTISLNTRFSDPTFQVTISANFPVTLR